MTKVFEIPGTCIKIRWVVPAKWALVFLILILMAVPSSAAWWNTSWKYRVDNPIPNGTRPYQLSLNLSNASGTNNATWVFGNGHFNTNFTDIRFTLDNTTLLPHWIESNGTSAPRNIVWVNVTGNGTVNLYYGNTSATSTSNGNTTFYLFDDFMGTTVDYTKWSDYASTPVVSGGYLKITSTATLDEGVLSTASYIYSVNYAYRGKAKIVVKEYGYFGFMDNDIWADYASQVSSTAGLTRTSKAWVVESKSFTFSLDEAIYDVIRNGTTSVIFKKNGTIQNTHVNQTPIVSLRIMLQMGSGGEMWHDWALVRKYVYPEPTWATWSNETPIALLTFNSKYVIVNSTAVSTTSFSLVDDTPANQTFSLTESKTVLVIYNGFNNYGASENSHGKQIAINIDGTDRANTWNSPGYNNNATGLTTFWIGTLAAGNHTIKGRFASNYSGETTTISERVLLIYILDGDEFYYIDNSTPFTTSSTSFVDDTQASQTFTPSNTSKALILYNVGKPDTITESAYGKKIAINLGGVDYSQSEKSPADTHYPDNVFTLHYALLSATPYTVKGRVASHGADYNLVATVTISRRQMGILLFSNSTLADYITSDTQVSINSNYPQNDTQATINRTTTDTRELLVVAMGTKRNANVSSNYGEAYGIKINANDRTKSRNTPAYDECANSASTAYAETLAAGSHTIQGRFGNNYGTETAKIDSRRVVALWLAAGGRLSPTWS